LRSGLSIVGALDITATALSNVHFKEAVLGLKSEVEKGMPLAIPISRNEIFFPLIVSQMVAVGEEAGNLDNILSKMSEFFNDEVENMAGNLATMLEPFILVVMGGLNWFYCSSCIYAYVPTCRSYVLI
jgi:type IV pilus assembly protein PilC